MDKLCITEIQAWGGPGGGGWSFLPQGKGGITKIIIRYSTVAINGIAFVGRDGNGNQSISRNFGGSGGTAQEINLEYPMEYLRSIKGTYGNIDGNVVVRSLEFTTNSGRKIGPFGSTNGNAFNLNINSNSAIVGFHGRGGYYLDAIGVFIRNL